MHSALHSLCFALPNLIHTFVKRQPDVKSSGLKIRPGLKLLGPPLSSSVTLGKSCNHFNPQFPFQLSMNSNFHIYLIGLLGLSNEVRLLKKLGLLVPSVIKTISINVEWTPLADIFL